MISICWFIKLKEVYNITKGVTNSYLPLIKMLLGNKYDESTAFGLT